MNHKNSLLFKILLIISIFSLPSFPLQMPSQIIVEVTHSDGSYASTVTVDFKTYVQDVLGSEWPGNSPDDAMRAGALAVKEFGWWRHDISPRSNTNPPYYDIKDNTDDQMYIADNDNTIGDNAVDYIWYKEMLTHTGNLFKPQYRQGTLGDCTFLDNPHSGIMLQYGSCLMAAPSSSVWDPEYYDADIPPCYPYYWDGILCLFPRKRPVIPI
jgi:hypothetical protein